MGLPRHTAHPAGVRGVRVRVRVRFRVRVKVRVKVRVRDSLDTQPTPLAYEVWV